MYTDCIKFTCACTFVLLIVDYRQAAEESYKDLEILIQQQVLDQNELMTTLNMKLKESKKAGNTLHSKVTSTKIPCTCTLYTVNLHAIDHPNYLFKNIIHCTHL